MQEMFDQLKASKNDGYGLAFSIDMLLENEETMLEKEKEVMIDFAYKFGDEPLLEIAKWYDKQFNTEEK